MNRFITADGKGIVGHKHRRRPVRKLQQLLHHLISILGRVAADLYVLLVKQALLLHEALIGVCPVVHHLRAIRVRLVSADKGNLFMALIHQVFHHLQNRPLDIVDNGIEFLRIGYRIREDRRLLIRLDPFHHGLAERPQADDSVQNR